MSIIESKFLVWAQCGAPYLKSELDSIVASGRKVVVELLLRNGAQPDSELEVRKRCTLSRAIHEGHMAVIELLLTQGAKVNYQYGHVSIFNEAKLD